MPQYKGGFREVLTGLESAERRSEGFVARPCGATELRGIGGTFRRGATLTSRTPQTTLAQIRPWLDGTDSVETLRFSPRPSA